MYRFITVELSLPREERLKPHDFLKYVKDQYDRLQEISPIGPQEVIREFQRKFSHETEISKPEEANGLEKITIYRRADEEEEEAKSIGKPVLTTPSNTPKPPSMTPKASFVMSNPLHLGKILKKDEKKFTPTLKSVEEAIQSAEIPEIPKELERPPTPPKISVEGGSSS
jgi:hypothetical protein